MDDALDPFRLASRQIELDREATHRFSAFFEQKRARQLASPHAFLRGSAPLFYEILASRPDLAEGPSGEGFLVGDMHLENIGAYRNDDDEVLLDLNDFDDAAVGPWRLDVLRLATSVLLAGRSFQATGPQAIELAHALLDAYVGAACEAGRAPATPPLMKSLVERATMRTQKELLDRRAPVTKKGTRAFSRGEHYLELPLAVASDAPTLLRAYVEALGDRAPAKAGGWSVEDAAQRIAGTGSLGRLRVALLVRADADHERIVELKEAGPSSVSRLVAQAPFASDAERVVTGARALVKAPARHLAAVSAAGTSFLGRRLCPEEDKLALEGLHVGRELDAMARMVGHLLGRAHARAATVPPTARWTTSDIERLVDHAVVLAGMHEAIYLAYARRV